MARPDTEFVLALTTIPADFDADPLARDLLADRLAACVTVSGPMRSTYRWRGSIDAADERQVVIKTSRDCLERLQQALVTRHPYEVPEFIVVPVVSGSDAYLGWVREETR
jgi:periplasmic divalent cation tolerance protein